MYILWGGAFYKLLDPLSAAYWDYVLVILDMTAIISDSTATTCECTDYGVGFYKLLDPLSASYWDYVFVVLDVTTIISDSQG